MDAPWRRGCGRRGGRRPCRYPRYLVADAQEAPVGPVILGAVVGHLDHGGPASEHHLDLDSPDHDHTARTFRAESYC
jgi:hypothetical protein